mgnify:CR=1 FL=1
MNANQLKQNSFSNGHGSKAMMMGGGHESHYSTVNGMPQEL